MDCLLCKVDDDMRKQWGCDEDTQAPLLELDCWECRQIPQMVGTCTVCDDDGVVRWYRCPYSMPGFGNAMLAIQSSIMVAECHVLPAAGGWDEQTALFHQVFAVVMDYREMYRKLEKDQ